MSFLVQDSNTHLFTYTSSEHLYILVSWGYAYLQILIFIWKTRFLQLALPEMALDFAGFWKSVSQILRSDFTIIYLLVLQVNIFFAWQKCPAQREAARTPGVLFSQTVSIPWHAVWLLPFLHMKYWKAVFQKGQVCTEFMIFIALCGTSKLAIWMFCLHLEQVALKNSRLPGYLHHATPLLLCQSGPKGKNTSIYYKNNFNSGNHWEKKDLKDFLKSMKCILKIQFLKQVTQVYLIFISNESLR